MDKRIHVATIGAPFGVRGYFRLKTTTEHPKDALSYGPLTDTKGIAYHFTLVRVENSHTLVVSEKSTSDRTKAEALRGTKLYINESALPKILQDDAFYVRDLIGMEVHDAEGNVIGTVATVENYGASDILVIKAKEGGLKQIAFIEDSVLDICRDHNIIVIEKNHLL